MRGVIYVMPHYLLNCSSILKPSHNYVKYLTFLHSLFTHCLFLLFLLLSNSFFSASHSVFESGDHTTLITYCTMDLKCLCKFTLQAFLRLSTQLWIQRIFPTWPRAVRFPNCSCFLLLYSSDVNISSFGKKFNFTSSYYEQSVCLLFFPFKTHKDGLLETGMKNVSYPAIEKWTRTVCVVF